MGNPGTPGSRGVFDNSHLRLPDKGGAARPAGNNQPPRPFNVGNLPKPNSVGGAARPSGGSQTATGGGRIICIRAPCPNYGGKPGPLSSGSNTRPLNLGNLPKPNAVGGTRVPGSGGNTRPFNVGNLPKPNAVGGTRVPGNGGTTRPFNVANLPKPNEIGSGTRRPGAVSDLRLFNPNLPKPKTTGGGLLQPGNGGGVTGGADKLGAAKTKFDEANNKLRDDVAKTQVDLKREVSAKDAYAKAYAAAKAADAKLNADRASGKPKALLAVDVAMRNKAVEAEAAAQAANAKAASAFKADQVVVGKDRQAVDADKRVLQQATLESAVSKLLPLNPGDPHKVDLANLSKTHALSGGGHVGGGHVGGGHVGGESPAGANPGGDATQPNGPKEGGVVGAAEAVGAAQAKSDTANAKLGAAQQQVDKDKEAVASANTKVATTQAVLNAAQARLDQDKKNNSPGNVIGDDRAKVQAASLDNIGAKSNANIANNKLSADNKTVAEKQTIADRDTKELQQAQATLSDKQQIATLEANQQNPGGSSNQTPNNGQGSSGNGGGSQSSDNGQGSSGNGGGSQSSDSGQVSSGDGGGSQVASSNADVGTVSRGSGGGFAVNRGAAAVAGVAPVVVSPGVVPVVPGPAVVPPPPPAPPPGEAPSDQAAAINPTVVMVGFQKGVSNDDVAAFLDAYSATIVEGPNNDGLVKIQITAEVPADQVQAVLDSMKSQTNIVQSAAAQ